MPQPKQTPESDDARKKPEPYIFVPQRSRNAALFVENLEARFAEARHKLEEQGLFQTYEAYSSGQPCPACERPLLDKPSPEVHPRTQSEVDAENAAFRGSHNGCLGLWHIENNNTEHCHLCCPPPPLGSRELERLSATLTKTSLTPTTWHLKLTCGDIKTVTAGSQSPTTAQCSKCSAIRGVIAVAKDRSDAAIDASNTSPALTRPPYEPLTDEQWELIEPLIQTDRKGRRGRPRADLRSVLDAILYREHAGISWRELPLWEVSWQTVARRHRQLKADGTWSDVLDALATSQHSRFTPDHRSS